MIAAICASNPTSRTFEGTIFVVTLLGYGGGLRRIGTLRTITR